MTTSNAERRGTRPRIGQQHLRVPRTLDDAANLAAWVAYRLARGKLDEKQAAALTKVLDTFRSLVVARDADAKLAEAQRVLTEMKALRAGSPSP